MVGVVMMAAAAWACVPVATLQVSSTEAAPGDTLTVTGRFYNENAVTLHWNDLQGPELATITPDNRLIEGSFTVPSNAEPGNYVIVANQERAPGATTWGIPSRALVTVVGEAGAPAVGEPLGSAATASDRIPGLTQTPSVGAGEFALVALGVAGLSLFVAGGAALLAGRSRGSAPTAATASSRSSRAR